MQTKSLLSRTEAAKLLCERGFIVAPATLARLASVGGGPEYISFGRRVLYAPNQLIKWAEARARVRKNTSDLGHTLGRKSDTCSEGV